MIVVFVYAAIVTKSKCFSFILRLMSIFFFLETTVVQKINGS